MRVVFVDGTVLDTADPNSRQSFLRVRGGRGEGAPNAVRRSTRTHAGSCAGCVDSCKNFEAKWGQLAGCPAHNPGEGGEA